MKKIIIVNNNLKIGGIQKSLVNLLNNISNMYDITLLLFEKDGEYLAQIPDNVKIETADSIIRTIALSYDECSKKGFKYKFSKIFLNILTKLFGNGFAINFALLFERKLKGYDIAISYMHCAPKKIFYGGPNEFVLKKIDAIKKISFVHCDFKLYGGDINYSKKIYSKFDKIVFCSNGCLDSFNSIFNEFCDKSYVVYNFINSDYLLNQSNIDTFDFDRTKKNILFIGRVTYDKGADIAIELIKKYVDEYSNNIHLYFIGDSNERSKYENMVNNYELQNYISFCGNQVNVSKYLKNADILLHVSRQEAAPMVFDEANFFNIPVLSSKTTSAIEMIENRGAGIVGDSFNDLYDKFIYMLNNNFDKNSIIKKDNKESIRQLKEVLDETI